MDQVAGLLEGHAAADRPEAPLERQGGQQLADVDDATRELLGPLGPERLGPQQLGVLLQRRAAAGRVDDDVVDAEVEKRADVPPSKLAGHLPLAAVDVEGTAAGLDSRDDD